MPSQCGPAQQASPDNGGHPAPRKGEGQGHAGLSLFLACVSSAPAICLISRMVTE
jgi:hypothetical protein